MTSASQNTSTAGDSSTYNDYGQTTSNATLAWIEPTAEVKSEDWRHMTTTYVSYVVVPLFLVTGLVGNSLTVAVMRTHYFRRLVIHYVLIALALSDLTMTVVFPFNKGFIREWIGLDVRALSQAGCKVFFWALRFAKITSSWFVVLISLERFVAVMFPLKAKIINTKRNIILAIVAIYLFIGGYITGWSYVSDRVVMGNCVPNTRPKGLELEADILLVIGSTMYAHIPGIIVTILNSTIVIKLLRQKQQMKKLCSSNKNLDNGYSHKTTGMLLGVSIAFVLLVCPISIAHQVFYVLGKSIYEVNEPGLVIFREVVQVLEQMNYSINFLLYTFCCASFRRKILLIMGCSKTTEPGATQIKSISGLSDTT